MSGAPAGSRSWRAALVVVTLVGGLLLASCLASPDVPSKPSGQSGEVRVSSQPSGETLPPLNRLELKVIDALERLGIKGQRAELPFQNASIWAQLPTGSQLFVNAAPTATRHGEFSTLDERQLEGIRVHRVEYASAPPPRHRFECSSDTYEIYGAVPPSFADMDAFVARFIRALGCGS